MTYLALARKWRPRHFNDMVGQSHVLKALTSALSQQRLHHAYLFTGTRGVGKTTIARIFAKSLNCEQGVSAQACGVCSACVEVDNGRFIDLIEVDAASRTKVEDTRDLLENVQYLPTCARYKVYLIDEVHMLSTSSFNALLKTLEEPPPHVKFLLATTDPQKLPMTVLSRCLQFHLKALNEEQIQQRLQYVLQQEKIGFDQSSVQMLARAAAGSLRDALSLLDQAIAHGQGALQSDDVRDMLGYVDPASLENIITALCNNDVAAVLQAARALEQFMPDYASVMAELSSVLHGAAVLQQVPQSPYVDNGMSVRVAQALSAADVQLYYQILLTGRRDLAMAPSPREGFEMSLLRMMAFRPAPIDGGRVASKKPEPASAGEVTARTFEKLPKTTAANEINTPSAPAMANESKHALNDVVDGRYWRDRVVQLQLPGLINSLLMHSAMADVTLKLEQVDTLRLLTDDDRLQQWTSERRKQLQDALSKQLQRPLAVEVAGGLTLQQQTPAQWEVEEQKRRLAHAQQSLDNDPMLRELLRLTDAKTIESTLRSLH